MDSRDQSGDGACRDEKRSRWHDVPPQLADVLRTEAQKQGIAGMSAAFTADGRGYAFNLGIIDEAASVPPTEHTAMCIASLSKSVTATLVCMLHAEGRLDIDAPVCAYLPDFHLPPFPREAATVRHLMNHRSGLPSLPHLYRTVQCIQVRQKGSVYADPGFAPILSTEDLLALIRAGEYTPSGTPGTEEAYSNEGYALLGAIVEQASGMPLARCLSQKLLVPLGMRHTGYTPEEMAEQAPVARMFAKQDDGTLRCLDAYRAVPPVYRAAAFLLSTSADMNRYYRMLSEGGLLDGVRIVPQAAYALQVEPGCPVTDEERYALGFSRQRIRGRRMYHHGGGMQGVAATGGFAHPFRFSGCVLINQQQAHAMPVFEAMLQAAGDWIGDGA